MKKKILNILKYIAFTSLGITLFWLVYRDQDFNKIFSTLKNDVNYFWVILSLFLGLLSHISRTLRWKIALEPLGEKPRTINTFITVMAAYFMNLLLPRMGEFIRCGLLSKYEKIPFPKLFGTVITERIVDVIMLFILFLIVGILEFDVLVNFGKQNPEVIENAISIIKSPLLWIGLVLLISGIIIYFKLRKKRSGENQIEKIIAEFIEGIKSVITMKRYKEYIAHTIFIWLMYFLMLYCVFFSLDFTKHLGPEAGLTTFVMGTLAMLAPVQAGIGAWHFMVEKSLLLYGVESMNGKIFALLAHTSTNALIILLGVICIIILPIVNRNYNPKRPDNNN
ncbi:MAG: flippase-like domain-containing protein [Prolixibacteraceae bacterium]|nr:flippase-like domain-containing protein [Prolixibacteraceae bacterium]